MSNFTDFVGGAGIELAPDLTFPSRVVALTGIERTTGINAVGALTEALGLAGKFSINLLRFESVTSESITIKLTVDGVVIWNSTFSNTNANINLLGSLQSITNTVVDRIICKTSLSLEIQTTADASVDLAFLVRPIL